MLRTGKIDLSIKELLLDSDNPRIEHAETQRDALEKLIEDQDEKLAVLAEDIVSNGMSPIDRLLVLQASPRSSQFITLEGNRRVAALKILNNPHQLDALQVGDSLRKKLQSYAVDFDRTSVEPIDCFAVGSREQARRWIHLRHTGENDGAGVVAWGGIPAARFRGSDPALQAFEFVRAYGGLSEWERASIKKSFPISTLERLLDSVDIRKLIGVQVENGKLYSELPPDEVIKALRRIVLDLAAKRMNVSKLKNSAEQIAYVKSFDESSRPDMTKRGSSRAIEDVKEADFKRIRPSRKARPLSLSERKTIVPRGFRPNVQDNRADLIFGELKRLKFDDASNAISVLLRLFLEISVVHYMDKHSIPLKSPDGKGKELQKKVEEVSDHLVQHRGCSKRDFAGVKRAISEHRSPLFIGLLHDYVHNRFVIPKQRELIAAWAEGQRLFEKIWE